MNTPALLRRCAFLLCILCTFTLSLAAHAKSISVPTAKDSGVTITMNPAFDEWKGNGFMPVRIEISNASPYRGNWELTITNNTKLTYKFAVPPGGSLQEIIYPNVNTEDGYNDIRASWEGSSVERSGASSMSLADNPGWKSRGEFTYIGEKSLSTKQEAAFSDAIKDNGTWNPTFSIMDWPADPRVFSSKEGMVIPEETFTNRIDEAHRQAILDWVATGGTLWLVTNDKERKLEHESHQFGRISYLPDVAELPQKNRKDLLDNLVKDSRSYLQSKVGSIPTITNTEAMEYKLGEPSMYLGILLLVFALCAGPISLKYWAPVGKRQRLFLIIPALALVFSSILGVAILLSEGIGGKGIRKTQIILFPDSHSAFICQNQLCTTGVIVGQSFPLDPKVDMKSTRITNMTEDSMSNQSRGSYVRNGSVASGNWFPDRTMLKQSLSTFVPTRARVTLLATDKAGAPVLQSTFPSALGKMVFRDAQNKFWKLDALPPGQKVTATPLEKPSEQDQNMRPNTFYADAEHGELGPIPTHPDISWKQDTIRVSGTVSLQASNTTR